MFCACIRPLTGVSRYNVALSLSPIIGFPLLSLNMLQESSSEQSYEFALPSKPFEATSRVRKRRNKSNDRTRSGSLRVHRQTRPKTSPTFDETRARVSFGSGSSTSSSALHHTNQEVEQGRHSTEIRAPMSYTIGRSRWEGTETSSSCGYDSFSPGVYRDANSLYSQPLRAHVPTYRSDYPAPRNSSYPSKSLHLEASTIDDADDIFDHRSDSAFHTSESGKKRRFSRSNFLHSPSKDKERSDASDLKIERSLYKQEYT